ncbi:hypothetical protein THAOC_21707, partial [Thalassiosira oceanica]
CAYNHFSDADKAKLLKDLIDAMADEKKALLDLRSKEDQVDAAADCSEF